MLNTVIPLSLPNISTNIVRHCLQFPHTLYTKLFLFVFYSFLYIVDFKSYKIRLDVYGYRNKAEMCTFPTLLQQYYRRRYIFQKSDTFYESDRSPAQYFCDLRQLEYNNVRLLASRSGTVRCYRFSVFRSFVYEIRLFFESPAKSNASN